MIEEAKLYEGFAKYREDFKAAMDDDLNTADAISHIFSLVRDINSGVTGEGSYSKEFLKKSASLINELLSVLGLEYVKEEDNLAAEVEALIEKRQQARKEKNFALADEIRNQLSEMGIILEDTRQGVKWSKA